MLRDPDNMMGERSFNDSSIDAFNRHLGRCHKLPLGNNKFGSVRDYSAEIWYCTL